MAYQFADPFDHYNTAILQAGGMWETVVGSPLISSIYTRFSPVGSYPNQGCFLNGGSIRKNLKSNQATLISFFSYGGGLPASGSLTFAAFLDNGTYQCSFAVTSTGALQILNSYGGSILGQSAAGLLGTTSAPAHGIEAAITFSGSVGSIQVWADGNMVIPLTTGLNTITSGNPYANQFKIGYIVGSGANIYTDYVRIWDATGSYQNAPLGYDVRKLTKLPQGAGGLTQWTANGAASNWQCVNDNPPDGDTTYVSSAGNLYDSYAMGSAGFTNAPTMTVAKSYARKDDGATRVLEIGARSSGVNGLGAPAVMGSSYAFYDSCISTDPSTGNPPTAAAADAFQHLKYEST